MGPKKAKKKNLFSEDDEEAERRAALEEARQQKLEEERIRKENEIELKRMKEVKRKIAKREKAEEKVRETVLQSNCLFFSEFLKSQFSRACWERKEKDWVDYRNCVQPFPYDPPCLNTFLSHFHEDVSSNLLANVIASCRKATQVIIGVDDYINHPVYLDNAVVTLLVTIKEKMCEEIVYKFDCATFEAIMNVDKNFDKIQFWRTELLRESDDSFLWLWGWAVGEDLEKKKKNIFKPKMPKRKISKFSVRIPRSMKYKRLFLRVAHVSYDIFGWRSSTYPLPLNPENWDLFNESLCIRKEEIEAIKKRCDEFDKTVLPWWYLEAFPLDSATLEKTKVDSRPSNKFFDSEFIKSGDSELNITDITVDGCLANFNYKNLPIQLCDIENTKDITKPEILYSNFMMIQRKKEKVGNKIDLAKSVYLSKYSSFNLLPKELKTSAFDNHSFDPSSDSDDDKKFPNERKTTFRATLYSGALNEKYKESVKYLKAFNKVIDDSDHSEEEEVTEAPRNIFLSWDFETLTPSELEKKYFDFVFNKRTKKSQGKLKLRSLRELLDKTSLKGPVELPVCIPCAPATKAMQKDVLKLRDDVFKRKDKLLDEPLSFLEITTPSQMKAFDCLMGSISENVQKARNERYEKALSQELISNVINLRECHIIGGIYLIDLVHCEPQPKIDQDGVRTQVHFGEYKIKKYNFYAVPVVHFDAAAAAERQIRATSMSRNLSSKIDVEYNEIELEDDETIHVTLQLYDKAIWISNPFPVLWDEKMQSWSKDNVYDEDFSEDDQTLFFKLGITSMPLAVACPRWDLLPFKGFRMKPHPEKANTICFIIFSSYASCRFEFEIGDDIIKLISFDHAKARMVDHIIGAKYSSVDNLIYDMRSCNLDIFPECDTFLYAPRNSKKLKSLEEHLYLCMAISSSYYAFKESHYNREVGERKIIFKMKPQNDFTFKSFLSTPFGIHIYSEEIIDTSILDAPNFSYYYPDVKNYIERTVDDIGRVILESIPSQLVANVYNMLFATKILSYS